MSKKISKEEFLSRFYRNYPEARIELINYSAISNPLELKCLKCGKTYRKERAREFLSCYNCCDAKGLGKKIDKLKKMYGENDEWEFVKQVDKDHYIVHHNKCGQDIKRVIGNALDNPFACKYCNTSANSQMLSIEEVQEALDQKFLGDIQILDYNGQLKKNHYKCLKCGLIFVKRQSSLMESKGCPKCNKKKAKEEKRKSSSIS